MPIAIAAVAMSVFIVSSLEADELAGTGFTFAGRKPRSRLQAQQVSARPGHDEAGFSTLAAHRSILAARIPLAQKAPFERGSDWFGQIDHHGLAKGVSNTACSRAPCLCHQAVEAEFCCSLAEIT